MIISTISYMVADYRSPRILPIALRFAPICKHDYLFAQAVHKRVAYEGLREIIAEARGLAALSDDVTAHTLRHNFAIRMHKAGATIQEVQASLGHTAPNTTFIYLRLNEGDTSSMRRFGARIPASQYAQPAQPAPTRPRKATVIPDRSQAVVAPAPVVSSRRTTVNATKCSRAELFQNKRRRIPVR